LLLEGDLELDGKRETRAAICRCSQSANEPYCGMPAMGVQARPLKITAAFICAVLSLATFWLSGHEA
jgi:hypothetical protein